MATVIDCHTKACIGYALAEHMRADLVIDALQMALLLFLWVRFGGAAQGAGPLLPGQGRLRRRCARALRAPLDLRASATPSGRACGQAGGLPGWCAAPPNLGCSVAAVKIVE
jgi:transposase InsO family protein